MIFHTCLVFIGIGIQVAVLGCGVIETLYGYEQEAMDLHFSVNLTNIGLEAYQVLHKSTSVLSVAYIDGVVTASITADGIQAIVDESAGNLFIRIPAMNTTYVGLYILRRTSPQTNITCIQLSMKVRPLEPTITAYTVVEGISGRVAICEANQYRPDSAAILFQINGRNVSNVPHVTVTENVANETYSMAAELNTVLDRNSNGNTASCSLSHDTLQTPIVVSDTITVYYAPDVVVNTTNVTVYDTALLSCVPTGMPDIYTYIGWNHIWPGHGVVRTNSTLRHSPTLSMSRLTYEYSGIYECSVSNGVTGSLNPNAGYGAAYLDVGTFPIIITASPIQMHVTSQIDASITIYFYSNRQNNSVECFRNSTRFNCATLFQDVDIVLPLFDSTVKATGTSAKVFSLVQEIDNSGEIVVKIINEVGESRINVNVVYGEDVPDPTINDVLIGAIVGSVVVVVVCVVVSIVVIIVRRRQASMENKQESVSTNRKDLRTPVPIEIEMESIDGDNDNIEKNVYEELGERNEDVHEYGDVSRGHEGGGRGASIDISYENLQLNP